MKEKIVEVKLPEGVFETKVALFEESDRENLYNIYNIWRSLCTRLTDIHSRSVNLPEGLSEGAFCLEMGTARFTESISGANTSFDAFDLKKMKEYK